MIQVLRTRHTATVNGSNIPIGLSDVAFASNDSRQVSLNLEEMSRMLTRDDEFLIQCQLILINKMPKDII